MEPKLQTNDNTQSDQNQTETPTKVAEATAPPANTRTQEQFSKLTESNTALNKNNTALNQENEQLRQQLASAKRPAEPAPKPAAPVIPDDIDLNSFVEVDKKTGERYVNETKLTKAITDLKSQTTKAEETIQGYIKTSENRRIQEQKDTAFTAYPELKPESEKFDKTFYRTVRAVLYDSMMNADEYGRTLSLKEAADYVRKELVKPPTSKEGGEEKEEKKEISDAKVQAGTMVPSQPQNAPQPVMSEDLQRLRLATRQGSTEALAQRILASDHVLKKA